VKEKYFLPLKFKKNQSKIKEVVP